MSDSLSKSQGKLGRRTMLTYAVGGVTSLAMALLPRDTAKAQTDDRSSVHVAIGSWSVKVTITASSSPFVPVGTVRWGVFSFTTSGTMTVASNSPTHGIGAFSPINASSISCSFIEQDFSSGSWNGNANVYAPSVTFPTRQSFVGQTEALLLDTNGNVFANIRLSLEGTRVALATPDRLPRQGPNV